MAPPNRQRDLRLPTMPTGVEVASFATYLEAQEAVDHLSDEAFDVRHVTIVGTDLRMVERITGRLTYARVAGAGAMSGAWFGLMIALVYWIFMPEGGFPLLAGMLIGAAFGILFAIVSYAFTGGKRDFTSASQVVASRYTILCKPEEAGRARQLLSTSRRGGRVASPAAAEGEQPAAPSAPTAGPGGPPANPYAAPGRHAAPPAAGPTATSPNAPPDVAASGPAAAPTPSAGAAPAEEAPRRRERPRYGLRLEDLEETEGGAPGTDGPADGGRRDS